MQNPIKEGAPEAGRELLHQDNPGTTTLLNVALEQAANSAFITDRAGNIVWVNSAFSRLTGYSAEEAIGQKPNFLKSGRQSAEWYQRFWSTISSGSTWTGRNINRRRDGTMFSLQQTVTPLADADGQITHFLSIHDDISSQVQSEEMMRQMALHDALTGLPNRANFLGRVSEAIARARRDGSQLAVLLLDLDHFKHVNDSLGHAAGDELLIQVGNRIVSELREVDLAARLGGDEFSILLESLASEQQARDVADRILKAVREAYDLSGNVANVGASIGIAMYPGSSQLPDLLVKYADEAMYEAKARGRNQYRVSQRVATA